jgi:hypothetical protein
VYSAKSFSLSSSCQWWPQPPPSLEAFELPQEIHIIISPLSLSCPHVRSSAAPTAPFGDSMNPPDQRPALQTRVNALPHPSGGKCFVYSQDMREFSMHLYHNDLLDDPLIYSSSPILPFPSMQTIRRYVALENRLGHFRPCRRTGNKPATALRDHNIVFLILYRIAYPKCSAAHLILPRYSFSIPIHLFRSIYMNK